MEAIVFPDVTSVVISAVSGNVPGFAGVAAYGHTPKPRPGRFVRVLRIGGPRSNIVTDNAMLTVEAWAETDAVAASLAQAARARVNAMEGAVVAGATVYTVTELSGPVNLPDPDSNHSRHTWTVQVACRGSAV